MSYLSYLWKEHQQTNKTLIVKQANKEIVNQMDNEISVNTKLEFLDSLNMIIFAQTYCSRDDICEVCYVKHLKTRAAKLA